MAELDAVLDRSGDAATVAWAHEGTGDVNALPDPLLAIAAAERLGNVAALLAVAGPKPVRKAAAVALHRLKSRGVKVEGPAPRAGVLGSEIVAPEGHAWLSFPDEDGAVALLVGFSGPGGTRVLDLEVTLPGEAYVRAGGSSRNGVRQAGAELLQRGGVELPFLVGLRYARAWAPADDPDVAEFLKGFPAFLLEALDAVVPEDHLPPPGADVPGSGWVYPVDAFSGDALDAAVEHLQERLAAVDVGDDASGRLPPEVEAAFAEAGEKLLDGLSGAERSRLADVARFGALVRRWHGAAAAADRLEGQAAVLEGTGPVRDVPEMTATARRVVLLHALRSTASGNVEQEDDDELEEEEE